jgi:hypothetical protein
MANLSTYTKNALVTWAAGVTSMPASATVYLALFNGDPTSGGSDITSTVTTGRLALSTMTTSSAGARASTNGSALVFTTSALAGGTWTYLAAYDAATTGNLLWYKSVTSTSISTGNHVEIAAGDLDITSAADLSGYAGDYLVNWMTGVASFPAASTRYVATFNGDPLGAGSENTTSIRAAGRPACTSAMGTASGGSITNTTAVNFGDSAGAASVTHLAIYDAASTGNQICGHALTGGTMTVITGLATSIQASALVIAGA